MGTGHRISRAGYRKKVRRIPHPTLGKDLSWSGSNGWARGEASSHPRYAGETASCYSGSIFIFTLDHPLGYAYAV